MGLFKWLERKTFLGDVLHEYGPLQQDRSLIGRRRLTAYLCRRRGKLQLVLKTSDVSLLGGGSEYHYIDVTPESVALLQEIALDLGDRLEAEISP